MFVLKINAAKRRPKDIHTPIDYIDFIDQKKKKKITSKLAFKANHQWMKIAIKKRYFLKQ